VSNIEGVRALNRETKSTRPDLSRHNTEGTGNTEHNSVEIVLSKTVVHKQSTRAAINIGPWVANLTSSIKNTWDGLIVSTNQRDQVVILNVLVSKIKLAHETRIGLTENSVTVARDNLTRLKSSISEINDILFVPVITILLNEAQDVTKALLVSKTVEGTSQTIHTSRE